MNTVIAEIRKSISEDRLPFDFSWFGDEAILRAGKNLFPEGKLIFLQPRFEELENEVIISGNGSQIWTANTKLKMTCTIVSGAWKIHLTGEGHAGWKFADLFGNKHPGLLNNFSSGLILSPKLSTDLIYDSKKGTVVEFSCDLNLNSVAAELFDFLDWKNDLLKGYFGFKTGGESISFMELFFAPPGKITLGQFGLDNLKAGLEGIFLDPREFGESEKDEFGESETEQSANENIFLKPAFFIAGDLSFTAGDREIKLPVKLSALEWSGDFRFSAKTGTMIEMAKDQLAALLGKTDIDSLLPANFKIFNEIILEDFDLDFSLVPQPAIKRTSFTFTQKKDWEFFKLPSGKTIILKDIACQVGLYKFDQGIVPRVEISATTSIGKSSNVHFTFDSSSAAVMANLEEGNTILLGEIITGWVGETDLKFLPGMNNLHVSEFSADVYLKRRALNLHIVWGTSWENIIGDSHLLFNGYLAVAYDPQEKPTFKFEATGELLFKNIAFKLGIAHETKSTFTLTASNLKLSEILLAWTGEDLPDGMPDLISEKLSLTIASDKSFSIEGDFRVTNEQFNLAGKEVVLLGVKFKLAYAPGDLQVFIDIKGNPDWEMTPGIRLNEYALTFSLDKKKATGTAWKLGGNLDVTFNERQVQLGGEWSSTPDTKQLILHAGAQRLHDPLTAESFKVISGVDETGSAAILASLQSAGILNDRAQVTSLFKPWDKEFSFVPPEGYTAKKTEILDVVAGKKHFLSIDKLLTYDPHELNLTWKKTSAGSTWSLSAVCSMQFYTPLTGDDPVFRLRYGKFEFLRDTAAKETSFSFTAAEASLNIVKIPYSDAVGVAEPGGNIQKEDKIFTATFNLGALSFWIKDNKWEAKSESEFIFSGMPAVLSKVLENRISLGVKLQSDGLEFYAKNGLKTLEIPDLIQEIGKKAQVTLPELGSSAVKLTGVFLKIGKELQISLEGGFGLPEKLNEALGFEKKVLRTWVSGDDESLLKANLTIGTDGIRGKILNSPFQDIEGITVEKDEITVDLDILTGIKNFGLIKLLKPELAFDFKKGSFKAKGGYSITEERGLGLPLKPLKKFLELIQLPEIAEALPSTVSIMEVNLNPDGFKKLLTGSPITIPKELTDALDQVQHFIDKLPPRLKEYLTIRLPNKVNFDLNITPDGGVSFNIETEGKPIRFLLPAPTGLIGYELSRIDFGTALGGSLFKLEVSARSDTFDYLSIASALFLYDIPEVAKWLGPREILGRSFEARDLVVLIIYQAGVPIPIPVFYKKFAIASAGPEGLIIEGALSFPKPELNLMKALKIVGELKDLFTSGKDLTVTTYPIKFALDENYKEGTSEEMALNLVFNAGPLYIRLPKWIADEDDPAGGKRGYTLGITGKYQLLNVLNFSAIILNSIHHLFKADSDSAYFIKAFHITHRMGAMKAQLLGTLEAQTAWIAATPKEFATDGWKLLSTTFTETEARALLTVIPVDDQFLLNASDDKSTLIFLHGKLKISTAFEASATGGLLLSSSRAGVGLRLAGQVANNTFTWLLQGAAKIDKQGFLLRGKAEFTLMQVNIFSGEYLLTNDRLSIEMKAGDENLPISASGNIKGEFRTGKFFLEGSGQLRFFGLTATASHKYHFDETISFIEHKGTLQLGALATFELALAGRKELQNFDLSASLKGTVLSILSFEFEGKISGSSTNLIVQGKEVISLLGNKILDVDATWERGILNFRGTVDLFPGLESVIVLKNQTSGQIGREIFKLDGTGEFQLGKLNLDAELKWHWTPEGFKFQNTIRGILGQDVTLDLSGGNGVLGLKGKLHGAVKLFNDLLQVSASTNENDGPELQIGLKDGALQHFYFDGAFKLLGISSSTQLSWKDQQFLLLITHKFVAGSVFKSDYQLRATYSPEKLHIASELKLELDLQPVFALLGKGNANSVKVEFAVNNFSLTVENIGPPDPKDDPAIRERLRAINAEIARVKELMANANRQATEAKKQLHTYRQHAADKKARFNPEIPEQKTWWDYWQAKENEAGQIWNEIDVTNRTLEPVAQQFADQLRFIGELEPELKKRQTQADRFNEYYSHMVFASEGWRNGQRHRGDHRSPQEFERVYQTVLVPEMRNIIAGFTPDFDNYHSYHPYNDRRALADYFQTHIYGMWHYRLYYGDSRRRADEAKGKVLQALNHMISLYTVAIHGHEQRRNHLGPDKERLAKILDKSIRKGEGFLLVAQLEEKNHAQTDLLQFNIANNGMNKSQPAEGIASMDVANTWNVRFEADITFTLSGFPKPFTLMNIKWQSAHGIDLNRPMAEWLADVIIEFLKDNFYQVLGQQLYNIIEIIRYIASKLFASRNGDGRDPAIGGLQSLAELNSAEAIEEYLSGQ